MTFQIPYYSSESTRRYEDGTVLAEELMTGRLKVRGLFPLSIQKARAYAKDDGLPVKSFAACQHVRDYPPFDLCGEARAQLLNGAWRCERCGRER